MLFQDVIRSWESTTNAIIFSCRNQTGVKMAGCCLLANKVYIQEIITGWKSALTRMTAVLHNHPYISGSTILWHLPCHSFCRNGCVKRSHLQCNSCSCTLSASIDSLYMTFVSQQRHPAISSQVTIFLYALLSQLYIRLLHNKNRYTVPPTYLWFLACAPTNGI